MRKWNEKKVGKTTWYYKDVEDTSIYVSLDPHDYGEGNWNLRIYDGDERIHFETLTGVVNNEQLFAMAKLRTRAFFAEQARKWNNILSTWNSDYGYEEEDEDEYED